MFLHWEMQEALHKQMPYEVGGTSFLIRGKNTDKPGNGNFQLCVLLSYQNDNGLMTLVLRCGKMYLEQDFKFRSDMSIEAIVRASTFYPFSSV